MAITTITTTAAEDARIIVAFGNKLGLGRPATGAEVKSDIAKYIARVVTEDEARVAAMATPAVPISPT